MAKQDTNLSSAWWAKNLDDVDNEIARLSIACNVRILDPGIIERVLQNDASVCGARNPAGFEKLRTALKMHYHIRGQTAGTMGEAQTAQIVAEIVERADASGNEGLDIKLFGTMPITDAARIFALATGVHATGTIDRLQQGGARRGIAKEDLADWCDAFAYLQMLRLRTQHRRIARELPDSPNPNLVPVASLSALDRRVLKEALREVRKLQQRLAVDYP